MIQLKLHDYVTNSVLATASLVARTCALVATATALWLAAAAAGGNIPKWLQNATIAKTVANDVPNFFDYLAKH